MFTVLLQKNWAVAFFILIWILFSTAMQRLCVADRKRNIGRFDAEEPPNAVASHFGVHLWTISSLITRFRVVDSTVDGPRSGRPGVTTPCTDRKQQNPKCKRILTSIDQLTALKCPCGARTIIYPYFQGDL